MTGRLGSYVHVRDAAGAVHVYGPADDVPEWAVALVTNPAAWAEEPDRSVRRLTDTPPAKRAAPRRGAADGAVQRD